MSADKVLKRKSFEFAIRVINLFKYLRSRHSEFVLSQQVLRAGTAIGALLREAEYAESKKDFKHKLKISLKECNECLYWLELLFATGFMDEKMHRSMINDVSELLRMLISSIKTLESKESRNKKTIKKTNNNEGSGQK